MAKEAFAFLPFPSLHFPSLRHDHIYKVFRLKGAGVCVCACACTSNASWRSGCQIDATIGARGEARGIAQEAWKRGDQEWKSGMGNGRGEEMAKKKKKKVRVNVGKCSSY